MHPILASSPLSLLASSGSHVFWLYAGFITFVLLCLALDLGVFHREAHAVSFREALGWTGVWVTLALCFNVAVYYLYENRVLGLGVNVRQIDGTFRDVWGIEAAKLFFSGYVVEQSLSMDNVFVIALILGYFKVPEKYQHRVLFWGILGALVLRGAMIAIGTALIASFSWIVYVFGAFLLLTALKMAFITGENVDPGQNPLLKVVRRLMRVAPEFEGAKFFTRWKGQFAATPLFLALVLVEFTDLIFAVDSIPAIFGITADPFLVFTSNVFAILGLRSLYFCLANLISKFRYLKPALILVLAFVGAKMLLVHTAFKIDTTVSLIVILGLLGSGVLLSLLIPAKPGDDKHLPGPEGILDPFAGLRRKKDKKDKKDKKPE